MRASSQEVGFRVGGLTVATAGLVGSHFTTENASVWRVTETSGMSYKSRHAGALCLVLADVGLVNAQLHEGE